MKHPSQFTRRQWLGATAATAGGLLLPGTLDLNAAPSDVAETKYFWCPLAPDGPYIDSQRDQRAFGFGAGKILLSEDSGKMWPHRAEFAEAENITFTCLLRTGNILAGTRETFPKHRYTQDAPPDHCEGSRGPRLPPAHAGGPAALRSRARVGEWTGPPSG